MEQLDYSTNPTSTSKKKVLPILVIGLIIFLIIVGTAVFFVTGDGKVKQLTEEEKPQFIPAPELGKWSTFEGENITFNSPPRYRVDEREKGYFVISKESNDLDEAEITIDARKTKSINSDYEVAVKNVRASLENSLEKDLPAGEAGIPNGLKIYGVVKNGSDAGQGRLSVYLKSENGAVVISSSGEKINEAIFDAVVASIKIN